MLCFCADVLVWTLIRTVEAHDCCKLVQSKNVCQVYGAQVALAFGVGRDDDLRDGFNEPRDAFVIDCQSTESASTYRTAGSQNSRSGERLTEFRFGSAHIDKKGIVLHRFSVMSSAEK